VVHGILQDLIFAARSLVCTRGVTTIAVVSLAIGIAANATIFSVVSALEFPRLIYPDVSRLVFLESRNHARGLDGMLVSVPDAADLSASTRTLQLPALTADQTSVLREAGGGKRISGRRVDSNFFRLFGVPPRLGRTLDAADGPDRIVLSDSAWRSYFGGDTGVIGRAIHLDGGIVTVTGVMPPGFDEDAEFWTAIGGLTGAARDDRQFTLFARLKDAVSIREASSEITDISRRLAGDHPGTNTNWEMFPVPLRQMHGRDARRSFLLLQGAVAFVLLIACANIANILLARGTVRRHEMAVRVSLGASRWRLLRGLLIEGVLLSLAGGALGLLWSVWGVRLARQAAAFPGSIEPHLNSVVVAFTLIVSVLCGIICSVVPALRSSAVAPETVLRAEGRGASSGRGWLRSALVAAQIAVALALGSCGALMVQTLLNRERVDLGFDPRGAIRADVVLDPERYTDAAKLTSTVDAIFDRLTRASGVTAAGASTWALPTGAGGQRQFTLPDEGNRALPSSVRRGVEAVTPAYFEALGARLIAGRSFTRADGRGSAAVAIVNQELAARMWPNRPPIGQALRLGTAEESAPIVTVVGVVASIRRSGMHDVPPARAYLPFAQHPNGALSVVVRSTMGAGTTMRDLEAAVLGTDSTLLVEGVRTLDADAAQFVAPIRMMTSLLAAFAVAGILLSALGVFGSMSYAVSQRGQEMAVRSALGASPAHMRGVIFSAALRIVMAGIIAGVAATLIATRALESFLFEVGAADVRTIASVGILLTLVALAACYRPARAAAATDPLPLLRR